MAKGTCIGLDPDAMRAAILEHATLQVQPVATVRKLSPRERKLLREGDVDEVFAARRTEIAAYSHALLNADPHALSEDSYGFQIQQKELERWWRLAFPEKLRIEHSGEIRRLPDAELVALVERLGLAVSAPKALTA